MDEASVASDVATAALDDGRAAQVRPWLRRFVETALAWITTRVEAAR